MFCLCVYVCVSVCFCVLCSELRGRRTQCIFSITFHCSDGKKLRNGCSVFQPNPTKFLQNSSFLLLKRKVGKSERVGQYTSFTFPFTSSTFCTFFFLSFRSCSTKFDTLCLHFFYKFCYSSFISLRFLVLFLNSPRHLGRKYPE